jgi:hypothetical protein
MKGMKEQHVPSSRKRVEAAPQKAEERAGFDWGVGLPLSGGTVDCTLRCDVAVVLSRQAFGQLFSYAYLADGEMSCLGVVRREEPGVFVVEKFYLVEQASSAAHTEMEPEAVGRLVEGLLAEGKAEEARAIKCWAHSHPGMKCFWSGTDEKTCRHLVTDYLVSLVVAEGLELLCRLDVGGDLPFTVDGVPVYVDYDFPSGKEMEAYAGEVQAKVKPAVKNLEAFLGGLTPISLEEVGTDHGVCTYPCGEEEVSASQPPGYVECFEEDWFPW